MHVRIGGITGVAVAANWRLTRLKLYKLAYRGQSKQSYKDRPPDSKSLSNCDERTNFL